MSNFKNKVRNTDIRNLESPFAAARPERVGSCVVITHSPTIKKKPKTREREGDTRARGVDGPKSFRSESPY